MGLPLGYKHTDEARRKISLAGFGRIPWNKGKKLGPRTEEVKRKLSEIHKGKSYHNKGFQKGHKNFLSEETRRNIGKKLRAIGHRPKPNPMPNEKHWNWKGGVTKERVKICNTQKYRDWRKSVFERDNYTCQVCNIRGGNLEAHHIKDWATHCKLRFNIKNGQTLCKNCHKKITYERRK